MEAAGQRIKAQRDSVAAALKRTSAAFEQASLTMGRFGTAATTPNIVVKVDPKDAPSVVPHATRSPKPRSRHQDRLAKRTARRPLPGDKRAKPERKKRRWFWPTMAAILMVISGIAGAMEIADRWPESVPEHRLLDVVKPYVDVVECECCGSECRDFPCVVLRMPDGDLEQIPPGCHD
jgi:hypothetical protein